MNARNGPARIIWDITYACPLRCLHCHAASGRYPSRRPSHGKLLRIADALASLHAQDVAISGSEPLLVRGLFGIVERFSRAGSPVVLRTGGWTIDAPLAEELLRTVDGVVVVLDRATAGVHDRITGHAFSVERAVTVLRLLNEASRALKAQGVTPCVFGVEAGPAGRSVAEGEPLPVLHVSPDGDVHAMPGHEGSVGNVLDEPPLVLWQRALARRGLLPVLETVGAPAVPG